MLAKVAALAHAASVQRLVCMAAGFGLLAEAVVASAAHVLCVVLFVLVRTGSDEPRLRRHKDWEG